MNYNNENYIPPTVYSNPIRNWCRRKLRPCEYANVIGRCVSTYCANHGERHGDQPRLAEWMGERKE